MKRARIWILAYGIPKCTVRIYPADRRGNPLRRPPMGGPNVMLAKIWKEAMLMVIVITMVMFTMMTMVMVMMMVATDLGWVYNRKVIFLYFGCCTLSKHERTLLKECGAE